MFEVYLDQNGVQFNYGDKATLGNHNPDQNNPRGKYVYGHFDPDGNMFYVGKGTGRRAWSTDRHYYWARYVSRNLKGQYTVRIIADEMDDARAEQLEGWLISQYGNSLVNWINFGRTSDYVMIERAHNLRNSNRLLADQSKAIEKIDLEKATENYRTAVANIAVYAFDFELCHHGLIGQLKREEAEELGYEGDIAILDRLIMCLCKLGLVDEAENTTDEYFRAYRRDINRSPVKAIRKRIEKARVKQSG